MNTRIFTLLSLFAILIWGASCSEFEPAARESDSLLDGPVDGLSAAEHQHFLNGDAAFNNDIFTSENGLGPLFVATSCGSCHAGDGKGHPFTTLTRFGQSDERGNLFLNMGGPQLQQRAMPGYTPESIPAGAPYAKFMPPANTGLGFLDAVADEEILSWADPDDLDGDGISGVANWIALKGYAAPREGSVEKNEKYVGRFGKKGATYDLFQQTVTAYNQDIGITTAYEPYDTYSGLEIDPEIPSQRVNDVVFYLKTLKAPIPRGSKEQLASGAQLFATTGCAKCHRPEMKTANSSINALTNKVFAPYSDLLLHDMGPGLDDGYTEGSAKTYEWRTPPLWGLGLSKNSQGGKYFLLHDGRAGSIDEAIRLHGGEATQARDAFVNLSADDKNKLIQFLESL